MKPNKEKVGHVKYTVEVYDSNGDLAEIYQANSMEGANDLIEWLFQDGPHLECFVTKEELVQHIYKRPPESVDDF